MRFVLKQALCLVLLFPQFILHAQKTVTVHGEYTYVVPGDESLDQAKVTALERAKISILADTFGTVVGATSTIAVATENGSADISQFTLGESSVKGEWIETIGEPEYHILYSDTGLVINVKVRGKAREIVSAGVDVSVRILRNGTDDRFEAADFKDGDDLYLSFSSPVSGYLGVYLFDGTENVYCLLPYRNQNESIFRTEAGRRYLFFSSEDTQGIVNPDVVDEYVMTCSGRTELNRIYVIFSPREFYKADDRHSEDAALPRTLSFEDFSRWLSSCRSRDDRMCVEIRDITVSKR